MVDQIEVISLDRIGQLIDAYGANTDRWPTPERDLALVFIATSSNAQRLIEEAKKLDEELNTLPQPKLSPRLKRAVLDAFTPPTTANENSGTIGALKSWGSWTNLSWHKSVAAAAIFGLVCGVGISQVFTPAGTTVNAQQTTHASGPEIFEQSPQSGITQLALTGEYPAVLVDLEPQTGDGDNGVEEEPAIPLI